MMRVSYCSHQRPLLVEVGLAQHPLVDLDSVPDRCSRRSSPETSRAADISACPAPDSRRCCSWPRPRRRSRRCASPAATGRSAARVCVACHADLAPLIDQPGADVLVRLIDVPVEQLQTQALLRRLPSADAAPRRATSRCRARSRPASAAPPWSPPAASRGTRCPPRCARWRSSTAPARRATDRSASSSARRTRTSSNGLRFWLGVIRLPQFQSWVCTLTLSPSSRLRSLIADGGRPRNSIAARPEWIASTRTTCLSAKMPMKPSR